MKYEISSIKDALDVIRDLDEDKNELLLVVERAASMIRSCDYTPARSLLLVTLDRYTRDNND